MLSIVSIPGYILNYTHTANARWLASTPLFPNNVRDTLAGESSYPRV